jgi:hypothetical protein
MKHLIGRELPAKTLVVAIDCGKASHRVILATGEQGVIGEPVSLPTLRQGVEELTRLIGTAGGEGWPVIAVEATGRRTREPQNPASAPRTAPDTRRT